MHADTTVEARIALFHAGQTWRGFVVWKPLESRPDEQIELQIALSRQLEARPVRMNVKHVPLVQVQGQHIVHLIHPFIWGGG